MAGGLIAFLPGEVGMSRSVPFSYMACWLRCSCVLVWCARVVLFSFSTPCKTRVLPGAGLERWRPRRQGWGHTRVWEGCLKNGSRNQHESRLWVAPASVPASGAPPGTVTLQAGGSLVLFVGGGASVHGWERSFAPEEKSFYCSLDIYLKRMIYFSSRRDEG